jgi:hypothetical protein
LGTVTYSDEYVVNYITENFVPWRVSYLQQKDLVSRFRIEWTPCVIILDSKGEEHHRTIGFLSPLEFIAQLILGRARMAFHEKDFSQAAGLFDKIVQDFPKTSAAAEAVWYRGLSRFQASGDASVLKDTRIYLDEKYSQSIWAEKASAWGA